LIITESLPPGEDIPLHRHLHEDEFLYIASGVVHARIGTLDGLAHAGALIFIPRATWVTLKNVGKTPVALLGGFAAPEYDRYMRCESVPGGRPAPPMTDREDLRCQRLGDAEYR
jgi:mannose-6-phosphate isomerase-like protein (cupin superfamily)